jgi:hypothetical protein
MNRHTLILTQKILSRLNRQIKTLKQSDTPSAYFEIKMLRKFKKMIATEIKRVHNLDLSERKVLIEFLPPPTNP